MKISIKLTNTQLLTLVGTLEQVVNTEDCRSRHQAIMMILMVKFYAELKKKTVMIEPRKYTISVAPETALAFIEFFFLISFDRSSQAGNLVEKLIREFDQKTTQYFKR